MRNRENIIAFRRVSDIFPDNPLVSLGEREYIKYNHENNLF